MFFINLTTAVRNLRTRLSNFNRVCTTNIRQLRFDLMRMQIHPLIIKLQYLNENQDSLLIIVIA